MIYRERPRSGGPATARTVQSPFETRVLARKISVRAKRFTRIKKRWASGLHRLVIRYDTTFEPVRRNGDLNLVEREADVGRLHVTLMPEVTSSLSASRFNGF